jgi:hypothetical protein
MFLERVDEQGHKLIRQTNGQLGATINDSDIYRVDPETGIATFCNPDTGQPFTGDNPRAQAKEWVEGYNDELRDAFNRLAGEHRVEVEQQMAPVIDLLKFTPTYEGLDPVRQKMLDALIEDYEVYDDNNNHIGYSCDLDKALAQVNKQVSAIQASRPAPAPTGPAVDMPTTGGTTGIAATEFKSLSEAMEASQDAQLSKLGK